MVKFHGTREGTLDGKRGTFFNFPVIGLSEYAARKRAKYMMGIRFPKHGPNIKVTQLEESSDDESRIPGSTEYNATVFVPHDTK